MKFLFTLLISIICFFNLLGQELRNDFSYEKSEIIQVEIVDSRTSMNGFKMETVVIQGYDSKFPFTYFTTSDSFGKHVILMHGLNGSALQWYYPESRWRPLVDSLLTLGYNVAIPDAKYHGARSYERNFKPVRSTGEYLKIVDEAQAFYEANSTTIRDLRIIIDYLGQRNREDDLQIDLVGYSMGGGISLILNAVDQRINSVVACVPSMKLPARSISDFNLSGSMEKQLHDITSINYSPFQNAPVLFLIGKSDPFSPKEEANEFIANMHIDDKDIVLFDSGHRLPDEFMREATRWITAHNKR